MQVSKLTYTREILQQVLLLEREYLKDEELCLRSSELGIIKCLSSKCSYGIFDYGRLVAFSLCYHSEYSTGYIEKCFVHPDYRGRGTQKLLLNKNLDALKIRNVDEVFAVVSPYNEASLKSFTRVGFVFKKNTECQNHRRLLLKKII